MSRILIAEDEPRIASFVEKGLRANGFTTAVVGDGRTALDQAAAGDFDLLVLDLGLPGMDGFAVLRRLRARPEPPPGDHPDRARRGARTPSPGSRAAPTTTWPSRSASRSCSARVRLRLRDDRHGRGRRC